MLDRGLQWAYGRWGTRYPKAVLAIQFQAAHLVALAGVALLTIYVSMPDADFLRILVVTQALILLDNLVALKLSYRMLRPVRAWLRGNRNVDQTVVAWRALVDMPSEFVRRHWPVPTVFNAIPACIYITAELGLAASSVLSVLAGALVVIAYGV